MKGGGKGEKGSGREEKSGGDTVGLQETEERGRGKEKE